MGSASSKKTAANVAKKKADSARKSDAAADGLASLKVDDTPLPRSKNFDVLKEFEKTKSKKNASFVVVGKTRANYSYGAYTNAARPRGRWKEHFDGPITP